MRVASDNRLLEVDPGSTSTVVVDVVNTGEVIDGISANVIGLADDCVSAQPSLLPLFPDTSGTLTLSLAVPPTHPAGRHPITVEVVSHGARLPSQYLDIDLDVSARPSMQLVANPRLIRARRSARFILELTNDGNVPLDVTLQATDAERSVTPTFSPNTVRVEPGTVFPVLLDVRGPRMFTGAEVDRSVEIAATAVRADVLPEAGEPEEAVPGGRKTIVRLRQRPFISRGLLTALILMGIVALWAGVFLLGLTKVFSNDPMTKQAPASFFAAAKTTTANANGSGAPGSGAPGGTTGQPGGATGANGGGAAAGGAAPAGALPKSGQVPAGLGGQITGTVVAASDHQPVGRILVQAYRKGLNKQRQPTLVAVSSSATQADGTYTIAGLFPTSYYLKFSATGFTPVWYPAAPDQPGARAVGAAAQGTTDGIDATVAGHPASISGTIDPGDTTSHATTKVTARPLVTAGSKPGKSTSVKTKNGKYTLTGLSAPGSYELTFITPGYQPSTVVDTVGGGDTRLEPPVTLGATAGVISGTVTDGVLPIGGATVTTTVAGKALTVTTPTTGQIGAFTLANLPTPATYVVTFSAPGHGVATKIVDLGAGDSSGKLTETLAGGTGSVTGLVSDKNGGVGGVTVTVGGATSTGATTGAEPTTKTLTSVPVGTFVVNGLPVPGDYTLTFTRKGYAPATLPVHLSANKAANKADVKLLKQVGAIQGKVTYHNPATHKINALPGATVTATDGRQSWTATTSIAGAGLGKGGYQINGLQPGTYTVTVTATGLRQQTRLVTVSAGHTSTSQDLRLGG